MNTITALMVGLSLLQPVKADTPPLTSQIRANSAILATSSPEDRIYAVFNDKRMVEVLKCESQLRQFDRDGNPLISKTSDTGIAQINQVHWDRAKELGLDIFASEEDNLKMGKIIYDTEGISAWVCAGKLGLK